MIILSSSGIGSGTGSPEIFCTAQQMKTARLTKKEDEFWEEVYDCLVEWEIHEDFTYDLCFAITKAKFERLRDIDKFV